MKKAFILALFAVLSLAGCGTPAPAAGTKSAATAFVLSQNGTLYSVPCLQKYGSQIAGGSSVGESCAAEKLAASDITSSMGGFLNYNYFYYVNPVNYYGGSNSSNFCSSVFGTSSWNGCYNWLGYSNSYYNNNNYYSSCSSCSGVSNYTYVTYPNGTYYYTYAPSSCPSSCRYQSSWTSQPWYSNWSAYVY